MGDQPEASGDGEIKIGRMANACLRWLNRATPLWGLCLALAAVAAFVGWRGSHDGDQLPKCWATLTNKTQSALYDKLVSPVVDPNPGSDSGSDRPLPQRSHDWGKPQLSVYSVEASHHALPTLRDLGDRGQEGAFGYLAERGHSWSDLKAALGDFETAPSGEQDPFRFNRVLVATVAKGATWDPGDRMMWTRVFVQPINFTFAGYSVASTDNETVNVADVEATRSRKFSVDLAATIPGMEGPKASVGPSSEHSVKTTSQINAEYEKLGIDVTTHFLRIIRESETGGDAVGNTTVALTTATDAETIWKRYPTDTCHRDPQAPPAMTCASDQNFPRAHNDNSPGTSDSDDDLVLLVRGVHLDDNQPLAPQQYPLDVLPQVPVPHCALRARVWMLYEERHIDSGGDSYDESKQAVTLARDAEDKEDLDVVSADEVSPAVWSLEKCGKGQCEDGDENKNPLRATVRNGPQQWRKVVFTNYGVAVQVAHWLRTNDSSASPDLKYRFDYGRDSQHGATEKTPLVPFRTTRDECRPQQAELITGR
jgi:hypothetical protein